MTKRPYDVVAMFHPSFHVLDLDEAERWYEDVFGVSSVRLSTGPVDPDNRMDYSTFTLIRDVLLDSIDPKRFVKQGKQQYATVDVPQLKGTGWYVDGVGELYGALVQAGIEIAGLVGVTEVNDGNGPPTTLGSTTTMFFTVPEDIGLRYQFIAPMPMHFDPRTNDGWELGPPSPDDPLGIEFTSHHTLLTDQPDRVSKLLVDVLGGEVIHAGRNEVLGASSTYIRLADGAFELAVPDEGTPAHDHWRGTAPNDSYYAITFKVRDLDAARRHLRARGIGLRSDSDALVVTDPATSMGVPWAFTAAAVPGDDRARAPFVGT